MKCKDIPEVDDNLFYSRINKDILGGCWKWISTKDNKGYGVIKLNQSMYYAHRVSFFKSNGCIDNSLVVDHMCKNPLCVNPEHLRQVTSQVNTLENSNSVTALNLIKTHCPKGHDLALEGVFIQPNGKPKRYCRTCQREMVRARKLINPEKYKAIARRQYQEKIAKIKKVGE